MSHIVVIGGSIMGSSLAYHMAMAGHADALRVIEPDPTYALAAAPRSAGGVRLMHSLPENIEMSRYGQAVYRDFARLMDVDGEPGFFPFRDYGYLHLVTGSEAVAAAEENWRVQTSLGAENELLTRQQLAEKFPHLRTDDIDVGLYGTKDGFIDPYAAVTGFRRKAESLGVNFIKDRVVDLTTQQGKVTGVTLDSGQHLKAEAVVNVAGAWAPEICALVGMKIPVEPGCRATFYFEIEDDLEPVPLTKDQSGVGFRTEGRGFATTGTPTGDPPGFRWEITQSDHDEFETVRWPALAHRVPAFERLKVKNSWTGHYAVNRFDGNTIIGPWSNHLENFFVATGFTGAGLQKGPAIGRALSELLLLGRYETIDLARLSYQRVIDNAPLHEAGFVA
ncbi:MAG: NAD(P)/FAD-dependent oxidoreductase [Hyphomicrobiaceae bacterium]